MLCSGQGVKIQLLAVRQIGASRSNRDDVHIPNVPVRCCFTSAETTSTDYQGRGARDGPLDFHTAPELFIPNVRRESITSRLLSLLPTSEKSCGCTALDKANDRADRPAGKAALASRKI